VLLLFLCNSPRVVERCLNWSLNTIANKIGHVLLSRIRLTALIKVRHLAAFISESASDKPNPAEYTSLSDMEAERRTEYLK
jgi:hypothetical protein